MRKARCTRPRDQRGATAVEYGLLAALVAAAVLLAVMVLGTKTGDLYECTGDSMVSQVTQC